MGTIFLGSEALARGELTRGRIQRQGWLHIRVIKEGRPRDILDRVRAAWARREAEARVAQRPA
jgi:hypothetical protein